MTADHDEARYVDKRKTICATRYSTNPRRHFTTMKFDIRCAITRSQQNYSA